MPFLQEDKSEEQVLEFDKEWNYSLIVASFFTSEARERAPGLNFAESISFHLLVKMPLSSEGLRIAALFSCS
jgi:hypothetical protein